eukprot:4252613-Pyramimonas_sp.AAC.1
MGEDRLMVVARLSWERGRNSGQGCRPRSQDNFMTNNTSRVYVRCLFLSHAHPKTNIGTPDALA